MIYKRTEESEEILKQIYTCIDENDGIAKKEQFIERGIDYRKVLDFVESGDLIRIKNGYYTYKMERFSEDALVSKLFPDGVLCMDSALYIYGYITTKPTEFHVAIDKNTSKSRFKLDIPKVIPYYTEPDALKLGVKEIQFENNQFQIYSKERLICDCLKYESKMNRKIFKQALLAYILDEDKDVEALITYARERKVLKRVQNVLFVWLDEEPVIQEVVKEEKAKEKKTKVEKEKESLVSEDKALKIVIDDNSDENNNPSLVEDLFEMMKNLEKSIYMSCFDRVNEQLKTKVISGLYTFQEFKDLKESEENVVVVEKMKLLTEYKNHEDLKEKWKQFGEKHEKNLDNWEDMMNRLLAFIGPIWESLCKDEVFFEDWMPELERFLG